MTPSTDFTVDSPQAWYRLIVVLMLSIIVGVGMWSVVVVLPAVQTDFGVDRSGASIPYVLTMVGYGLGGVIFGRFSDRFGIFKTVLIGIALMTAGYAVAPMSTGIGTLSVIHGILIGIGTSTTFAPLIAHVSHWFERRKGAAVGIIASGQYFAGAVWPIVLERWVDHYGWQIAYWLVALILLIVALPLTAILRASPASASNTDQASVGNQPATVRPKMLIALLMFSAFGCCVAMSMPQVHLVAFCSDLGFGPARGAQMLAVLLAFGVISRLGFGWISDRIGGLCTVVVGVFLQGIGLAFFLFADTVSGLFVVSAMFGLFQGGIVPAYALTVRENFPQRIVGERVGMVMLASLAGMAVGGWIPGYIVDITGTYDGAFINGLVWNTVTLGVVTFLLFRSTSPRR